MVHQSLNIHTLFKEIDLNRSWSFSDKTRKDTSYITHGYHRYPAKFIPQLASRLISEYSFENDLVVDPFCGCGTTNIEAKMLGRRSVGVDINPVATLISSAKKTAIPPLQLLEKFEELQKKILAYSEESIDCLPCHPKIDYWFRETEKLKLAYLLQYIHEVSEEETRNFFLCGFSNILKNCSIWLQKSSKPTRDESKKVSDPFLSFARHIKLMLRANNDYFENLNKLNRMNMQCKIFCADARNIPVNTESVKLVVTSPPYVTSYEYADLHQLTAFWFEYADSLPTFRKNFIGTSSQQGPKQLEVNSSIADQIIERLTEKSNKIAREVKVYFGEMYQAFAEMKRVLSGGG